MVINNAADLTLSSFFSFSLAIGCICDDRCREKNDGETVDRENNIA
jgi:hypothetical protein